MKRTWLLALLAASFAAGMAAHLINYGRVGILESFLSESFGRGLLVFIIPALIVIFPRSKLLSLRRTTTALVAFGVMAVLTILAAWNMARLTS